MRHIQIAIAVPDETDAWSTPELAAAQWNARPVEDTQAAEIEELKEIDQTAVVPVRLD